MKQKFKYSKLFYFIKYVLFFKISITYIKAQEKSHKNNDIEILNNLQNSTDKQSIISQKILGLKRIFSRKITSGGTTGVPTTFYEYYWVYFLETFYINYIFYNSGWNPSKKTVVFRGDKVDGIYQEFGNMLIISSYKMLDNIDEIGKKILQFSPTWIYAYPSVFYLFYKKSQLIKKMPIEGMLFGSEKLLINQKSDLLNTYKNSTVTEWYGLSEKALLGYRISPNIKYDFFKSYSKIYLVPNEELHSIYGTSYIQYPTKIINYDTGDFVLLDNDNDIIEIIGREQDFIYLNGKKMPFSQAIGSIHGEVWTNITRWQIIQEKENEIIFKIKTLNPELFNKTIKEMNDNLRDLINNGLIIYYVEAEKELELRTSSGKSKYFVQNITKGQ